MAVSNTEQFVLKGMERCSVYIVNENPLKILLLLEGMELNFSQRPMGLESTFENATLEQKARISRVPSYDVLNAKNKNYINLLHHSASP